MVGTGAVFLDVAFGVPRLCSGSIAAGTRSGSDVPRLGGRRRVSACALLVTRLAVLGQPVRGLSAIG